jgi:hypothetical protein
MLLHIRGDVEYGCTRGIVINVGAFHVLYVFGDMNSDMSKGFHRWYKGLTSHDIMLIISS